MDVISGALRISCVVKHWFAESKPDAPGQTRARGSEQLRPGFDLAVVAFVKNPIRPDTPAIGMPVIGADHIQGGANHPQPMWFPIAVEEENMAPSGANLFRELGK